MSTIVPKRRLRDTDFLQPDLLNEDFVPAAENASGYINEHNISANAIPEAKLGQECFSKQYIVQVSVNPGFGSGAYPNDYVTPSVSATNGADIANTGGWAVVDSLLQSLTSGSDVLHIMSFVQYAQQTWDGGEANLTDNTNAYAAVQFGVRIDGVVHVFTGTNHPQYKTFYPVRAVAQRTTTSRIPGPATPQFANAYQSGLGAHCNVVFLEALVPIEPGTHLVEIVGRRMMRPSGYYPDTNYVRCYNRKLYIEQFWQWPSAVSSFDGVTATPFESEDTFSASTIGANAIDAVRTKLNAVTSGMVRRGCLTHEHVNAGVLYDKSFDTIDGVSYTDTGYPGYNTSTVTAIRGVAGWWLVEDGAGDELDTRASHPSSYAINGKNCVVRVDIEVNVASVALEGAATIENLGSFGMLAIGYSVGGVVTIVGSTEVFVNHHAAADNAGTQRVCNECVVMKTMLLLDYRSSAASADIEWFGVYASTGCTHAASSPVMRWTGGCINVEITRY